jgi:hypothetical protein
MTREWSSAVALSAAMVLGAVRMDSRAPGTGSIVVWGPGVDVRVTDPLGRSLSWNGDSIANGIPECDAVEECLAAEGSHERSTPQARLTLSKVVPGEYEVRMTARQDAGAYLWVNRLSTADTRASAGGRTTLRQGGVAVWRVSWGCTERSDSCWATLRRVPGSKRKAPR